MVKRVIHTTADFDYARNLRFTPGAVAAGVAALQAAAPIVTDTNMALSGITKPGLARLGGTALCYMADPEVAALAKAKGITRSMAAMRTFGHALDGAVVAIGNAPTALYEVLRLAAEEDIRPAAIIGIPVGFVGAADSKRQLAANRDIPYITVEGTKGGSPIAAAAVNAIMYLLDNSR